MRKFRQKSASLSRAIIDVLEPRRFLSATLESGVLTINGTANDDLIQVSYSGSNVKVQDNGVTRLFALSSVNKVVINGNDGHDSVLVSSYFGKACEINGGEGFDYITGGQANDTIRGGNGNEYIDARAGNDIIDPGHGNDDVHGGKGNDTADYSAHTDYVQASFSLDDVFNDGNNDVEDPDREYTNLRSDIENIVSPSSGSIELRGSNFANRLIAGGADISSVYGLGGNDFIDGATDAWAGDGNDNVVRSGQVSLEGGDDTASDCGQVWGDEGNDTIYAGSSTIDGGPGNDTLYGSEGPDTLLGGEDDDELYGFGDDDELRGEAGNDTLIGGDGDDQLIDNEGVNVLIQ